MHSFSACGNGMRFTLHLSADLGYATPASLRAGSPAPQPRNKLPLQSRVPATHTASGTDSCPRTRATNTPLYIPVCFNRHEKS